MKTKKIFKLSRRHHILFWFFYFLLNTLRWGNYFDDYLYSLKTNVIGFPVHMILVYLNIFILMPRLVFKRKYFSYIIALIASLLLMVFIKFNLTYYLVSENIWPEGPAVINDFTFSYAIDMMIGELYVARCVELILDPSIAGINYNKQAAALEKMQSLKTIQRIGYVGMGSYNPNLETLPGWDDTMDNNANVDFVWENPSSSTNAQITEVLEHILHTITTFGLPGSYPNVFNQTSLILIPLVENAFKHGANKNIGNIKIDIDFKIIENFLYFTISNPVPKAIKNKQIIKHPGGIGLKNVKKRLALGYNPDEYELNIESKDKVFIVNLKIKV